MPTSDIDEDFRDSIKDDMEIFDNRETLIIHHLFGNADINFTTFTVTTDTRSTTVPNCLFRQPSIRNGPAVPQLHERAMAIQKDTFIKSDVAIEVPMIEGLIIKESDIIERPFDGSKWVVKMVDHSTLRTRYRLGCSKAE